MVFFDCTVFEWYDYYIPYWMRQFQSLHYDTLLQYKPLEFSVKISLSEAKCASERQIAFFINPHIKRSALYLLNLSRRLDFAPKFKLCLRGYVTLWAWGAFADPGLKIDTKHHKISPSLLSPSSFLMADPLRHSERRLSEILQVLYSRGLLWRANPDL